jgi:hypothetical protein
MKVIQLREVLQQMENGEKFSITYIKADRQRKTGGEIKTLENCVLYGATDGSPRGDDQRDPTVNELARRDAGRKKIVGSSRRGTASDKNRAVVTDSRNPNHYLHSTRNVKLQNGEIRKIHIRLIVKFNGVHVIY